MMIAPPRHERIDGTDYILGSREHMHAVAIRDARLDAAYVESHQAQLEEACRFLRNWRGFAHREDANLVAFFGQQLLFMRARVERVLREKLRMREFLQWETGYPRGAASYGQQVDDVSGEASEGNTMADDAPPVDVQSSVSFGAFDWIYASYMWTSEELDAAQYSGVPLLQRKAAAVAEIIARKLEKRMRSGKNGAGGSYGLFNNPNITVHTYTNGEHTTVATAAEMIADLFEIDTTLVSVAGDNTPDEYALLVPTLCDHRYRMTQAVSGSDMSVAEWVTSKSRRLKRIVPLPYFDDAVSPDIAASDAPMAMAIPVQPGTTLISLDHALLPVSVEYEERETVTEGYRFRRRAQVRVASVDVRQPAFCLYLQNND